MSTVIATKTDRQRLSPRREPYWLRLKKGCYVGFRKLANGEGTWIARRRAEDGKQHYRALGEHSSLEAALKAASAWFSTCDSGTPHRAVTVETACQDYVEHLRAHKGVSAAQDARGRFTRLVYGKTIASLLLERLKSSDVRKWLNAQVPIEDDPESIRKAKDSANRNLASLKAALNFAFHSRLATSDIAWKRVEPFAKAGKRRLRCLDLEDRRKLLDAMPWDLRMLAQALLLTGARPGEMASASVKAFNRYAGTLELDGKTGRRTVSLSSTAIQFFADAARGKIGNAPLIARENGNAWTKDGWKRAFAKAVQAANLPSDVVLYTLRHTSISEMIASGIDSFVVAKLAGTSTAMIDQHYGHLRHDRTRAQLDAAILL